MATCTISTAGGLWSATTAWTLGSAPTAADDVVATGTSGALTIGAAAACRSIDLTGYTSTLTHNAFILSVGTTTANGTKAVLFPATGWTYTLANAATSAISLISTVASTTLTCDFGGKTLGNLTINGSATTTHQLATHGFLQGASTTTLTQGGFDTNGLAVTIWFFSSTNSNTRTLTLGASAITVAGPNGAVWDTTTTTGLTMSAGTSSITFTGAAPTISSGGITCYDVALSALNGSCYLTNAGTYHNLTCTAAAAGAVWRMNANQTVSNVLTLTGFSTSSPMAMQSYTPGTRRTLALGVAGTMVATNVKFQDIGLTGTNTPVGGTSLWDNGDNSGIIFGFRPTSVARNVSQAVNRAAVF